MNSICLASILFTASVAAAGPIYNVYDLGTLGGSSAQAYGLSSNGIAAGTATTAYGDLHAFVNSGSGMTDLTLNSGASQGTASGVNASGQVAGAEYVNGQAYATVWSGSTPQMIAGPGSYAMAINNSGEVAGMLTSNGQGNAFVAENGVVTDLGTLLGGGWSAAYGINDQGEVTGYGQFGSIFRGFVWSPQRGFTVFRTLGGASSYAMGINDSGEVTGNSQIFFGYSHAFLDISGVMLDLGTLGGSNSYGYGINSAGDVVGCSYVAGNGATHAFLYENGVMIDLNSLLGSPGWTITSAYAINDSNEVVGTGLLNGVEHAVLLVDPPSPDLPALDSAATPEPGSVAMALTGLGIILLSRLRPLRRRRVPPREPPQ